MNDINDLRQQMNTLMRERGIRRLTEIENPEEVHSRIDDQADDRPYFTGYEYARLYGWDQYFEGILQIYADWELTYIQNSLKMFLERIHHDGFVPRTLPVVWWGMFHQQPFLAQQAVLLLNAGDDLQWFEGEYFYSMKAYLLYWEYHMDIRGEGLSVWDHAGHSGMDNQYERAGHFHDAFCEGVDLNCYLVREYEAFTLLAQHFGNDHEAERFSGLATRKKVAINRWCWNDADGCYYDYHARNDHQILVKHVGMFAALWAGVPAPAQAEKLVSEHLMNPDEFWRTNPLPAIAATEPGYIEGYLPGETHDCCSWRGHSWMPTNYYAFQGLRRYGFNDEARQLMERTEAMFLNAPFREYYEADSGRPCGCDPFWGWSSLALYMREELDKGTDPTEICGR